MITRLLTAIGLSVLLVACSKEPPPPAAADLQAAASADVSEPAPVVEPVSFSPFSKVDETMPAALEIPREGAELPLVVIIEAGSYECEYSRKAESMLAKVLADFPEAARFYLHNPLPGHKQGYLLALAAVAAQKQGRFLEFHRLLMKSSGELNEDRLLSFARKVGLDVPMFLKDLKRTEVKEYVERSRTLAAALGLLGTPVFLVNGKLVLGLIDEEQFRNLVKEELVAARKLKEGGARLADLHRTAGQAHPAYVTVMDKGVKWDETRAVDALKDPATRFRVRDTGWPSLGPPVAPVTVVEFLDLGCPHSAKAWAQANTLRRKYPEDVRFVFKLNPPSHSSRPAAEPFADPSLFAGGPDVEKVKLEAVQVMAVGTPVLYINGLRRTGYLESSALEQLLEQEIALARSLISRGLESGEVYEFLAGRGHVVPLLEDEAHPLEGEANLRFGEPGADSSLVVFWDYDSPFCRNLWPHLTRLLDRVEGKLSVYLKLLPDGDDTLLSRGAACAGAMGRLSSIHELLLRLGRSPVTREAVLAALGTAGFSKEEAAACLDDGSAVRLLATHRKLADTLGVKKGPALFLNGHRVKARTGLDFYSLYAAYLQLPVATQ